jgi:hypothetical protein
VLKKIRISKLITEGAKQATRTCTSPGQECGNETETRNHTNKKHSSITKLF